MRTSTSLPRAGLLLLLLLATIACCPAPALADDPPLSHARHLSGANASHRMHEFLLDVALKELPELSDPHVVSLLNKAEQLREQQEGDYTLSDITQLLHELMLQLSDLHYTEAAGAYPVTRRIVLSLVFGVVKGMRAAHAEQVAGVVDDISFEFYRLHREAAIHKGVVQFHHISKCGGTSMCHTAQAAGCSTQNFTMSWNCRIKPFGDTPIWTAKGFPDPATGKMHHPFFSSGWAHRPAAQVDSCPQRAKYLRRNGYTFFANELYLVGGIHSPVHATPCTEFLNVIVLRNPLARMLSNLKHVAAYYLNMKATPPQGLAAVSDTAPAVVDNFTIRLLLGRWIFDLALGSINAAHLELAKLKLQQFDVVLPLDRLDEAHVLSRYALGWNATLRDFHDNTGDSLSAINPSPTLQLSAADVNTLTEMNKFDAGLVEFGERVVQTDLEWLQAARRAAARRDPSLLTHGLKLPCGFVNAQSLAR